MYRRCDSCASACVDGDRRRSLPPRNLVFCRRLRIDERTAAASRVGVSRFQWNDCLRVALVVCNNAGGAATPEVEGHILGAISDSGRRVDGRRYRHPARIRSPTLLLTAAIADSRDRPTSTSACRTTRARATHRRRREQDVLCVLGFGTGREGLEGRLADETATTRRGQHHGGAEGADRDGRPLLTIART